MHRWFVGFVLVMLALVGCSPAYRQQWQPTPEGMKVFTEYFESHPLRLGDVPRTSGFWYRYIVLDVQNPRSEKAIPDSVAVSIGFIVISKSGAVKRFVSYPKSDTEPQYDDLRAGDDVLIFDQGNDLVLRRDNISVITRQALSDSAIALALANGIKP